MTPRLVLISLGCCILLGCYRQDMARQPKYHWPDMPSDFFADGHANRPAAPGTVARGQLRDDADRFTGLTGPGRADAPDYATAFPEAVDLPTLQHGRERYNIFCSVCHGRSGHGDGIIWRRGYAKPANFHDERLRTMPVGQMFEVITRGYGAMPDYAEIAVHDRWAIVAYIRVLQYSQNVPAADLSAEDRSRLEEPASPAKRTEGDRGR